MKLKKVLPLILAAVMSISLLAGCGGKEEAAAPEAEAPAVEEEAPAAEESAEAPSDVYDHQALENAGDITITMMVSGTAYEN